jgi:hypothetical protein
MIWLTALSWLKRVPVKVWAAIAVIVALWAFGSWRYHSGAASVQARWDAQEAVYAAQREAATLAARKTEERHRAEYKAIADRFLADQEKANEEADRVIADLRSGNLRLRQRFTCPRVSGASADPPGTVAEAPAGLTLSDVETVSGIARDGDAAIRQLNALIDACQVR